MKNKYSERRKRKKNHFREKLLQKLKCSKEIEENSWGGKKKKKKKKKPAVFSVSSHKK